MVEQIVMVPETVTEMRKVQVTSYKEEVQERVVQVKRMVPKTEKKQREETYFETETKVTDVDVCVLKPVMRTIDVKYTVCVPVTEKKQGMRTVCTPVTVQEERECTVLVRSTEKKQGVRKVGRCVPVVKKTIVCEDQGRWEQQAVACNSCAPVCGCCVTSCAPVTRCVWVPNIVQREVEITVHEWQTTDEPYEYEVAVCTPQVQKRIVNVCRLQTSQVPYEYEVTTYRREEKVCQKQVCDMERVMEKRQVTEQICVPRKRMVDYEVTTCECIVEDVKEQFKVCTPVVTETEVPVQVCRMVEKKIMVPAPTCCQAAPACSSCAPAASCCR